MRIIFANFWEFFSGWAFGCLFNVYLHLAEIITQLFLHQFCLTIFQSPKTSLIDVNLWNNGVESTNPSWRLFFKNKQ
jgi:hypothetical protein